MDDSWHPLMIHAAGACCAIGYNLAATECALRAGIDHFTESSFVDNVGKPLLAAQLDMEDLWGPQRLARLMQYAIADCESAGGEIDPAITVLLLVAAERGRPHTTVDNYDCLYRACQEQFPTSFHEGSAVFPQGRAGIAAALLHAQTALRTKTVKWVLLVGADSLLDSATIQSFLDQERVLATDNAAGFIPGEGAAALLLKFAEAEVPGLRITGVGRAIEDACPDGVIPNRAVGLSKAIRQACDNAKLETGQLDFRLTDQNGEQFFSKESANAHARVMAADNKALPLIQIADCLGETGAATGPLGLAILTTSMRRVDTPGKRGLLHFSSDDGTRAALIVELSERKFP